MEEITLNAAEDAALDAAWQQLQDSGALRQALAGRKGRGKKVVQAPFATWDESKHPRGQPGNPGQFGTGGGGPSADRETLRLSVAGRAHDDLARAKFSKKKDEDAYARRKYAKAVEDVTARMPALALSRLDEGTSKFTFLATRKDVNALFSAQTGASVAKGEYICGFYHRGSRELVSDGSGMIQGSGLAPESGETEAGTLAHEAGHAIDGPAEEYSSDPEWEAAYKAEHRSGKLSDYAATDQHEAFAEMCRAVYAPYGPDLEVLEEHLPLSVAFFRGKGLI